MMMIFIQIGERTEMVFLVSSFTYPFLIYLETGKKKFTSMSAMLNYLTVFWSHHHPVKQVLGDTVHHIPGERGTTTNEIIKMHTYEKDYLCS